MNNTETSFKNKNKIYYGLELLANDLVFSALSCFLAYYLRFFTKFFGSSKPTYLIDNNYILYSIVFITAVALISLALGLYFWENLYKKTNYYLRVVITPVLGLVVTLIFGRAYAGFAFSRLWILTLFILSSLLIFFSRLLIGKFTKKYFIKTHIRGNGPIRLKIGPGIFEYKNKLIELGHCTFEIPSKYPEGTTVHSDNISFEEYRKGGAA